MTTMAWVKHGTKEVDPIKAAREESKALNQAKGPEQAKRPAKR